MTTTELFSGMDANAKSSSRVLAPPGGASSNIFGGYQDDTQAKPKRPTDNDVFNQASAPQAASPAHKDIRSRNQRQAYNPITGEPIEDPKQREAEEQQERKEVSDSYNQMQARQNKGNPQQQEQQAPQGQGESQGEQFRSTRVSQPPGGRSTKLW